MLTPLVADATEVLNPTAWEKLADTLGPATLLAFVVVLSACYGGLYAVRAVFGKKGLAERAFLRLESFLDAQEARQETQIDLCRGMSALHEPGGRCDVEPLVQMMHPATAAAQKIADKVGADIGAEVREIHAALDRRPREEGK